VDEKRNDAAELDMIDVDDAYLVSQWTEIFGVTKAELTAAVGVAGCRAQDVKRYLRGLKR
jgi:hypothetical protein